MLLLAAGVNTNLVILRPVADDLEEGVGAQYLRIHACRLQRGGRTTEVRIDGENGKGLFAIKLPGILLSLIWEMRRLRGTGLQE